MKDAQVVDKLNVADLELERHGALLGRKVQSVERLGLRLRDGRDVGAARQAPVAGKGPPGILDDEPLRRVALGGLVVEQWTGSVAWLAVFTESIIPKCQPPAQD